MKGFHWLLIPALAGRIRAGESNRNLMTSCSELELDPDRGLLSAFCPSLSSNKSDHISQVDLNGCLGWGPSRDPKPIKYLSNELFPAKGGNFSQYCDNCHLIRESESPTQVGHILCNCAPNDSDVKLEYMYDLKKIMELNGSGCLECGIAPSVCSKKPESNTSSLDGEPVPVDAVPGLSRGQPSSLETHQKNISECDAFISTAMRFFPQVIPKPFMARPIRPCDEKKGPGLCCFYPVEGEGWIQHGFHLIYDSKYIYRIQYSENENDEFTDLEMVWRFCQNPDKCDGGEPDDNVGPTTPIPDPPFPTPTNTSTMLPPYVSTRPTLAATLNKRSIRSSTMSRNLTAVPEVYFPKPTPTTWHAVSRGLTSASPGPTSPELKIDLGKLNASGLLDIMLGATNIEEVKRAQLKLKAETNCFTFKDGTVNCNQMIVELTGHTIDGDSIANAGSLSRAKSVTMQETKNQTTTKASAKPLHQFGDNPQAVLGPRAVVSTEELLGAHQSLTTKV